MTTERLRIVLHIGQGKTGSTALQVALGENRDALLAQGVLFPDTGRHANHQDIFTYLTGDVKHHDPRRGGRRDDARKIAIGQRYWNDALDQIRKRKPGVLVLSCENQFRTFAPGALERLATHLKRLTPDVRTLVYLRDPASHFLSMVQQNVKKRPDLPIPSESAFRDVLAPWADAVPGPLDAVRYATSTLAQGDVVADFCERAMPFGAGILHRAALRQNTTMSAEAMAVLQAYHRGEIAPPSRYHAKRAARMKALVQNADAAVAGFTAPRLLPEVSAAIEARAADLGWVEDRFGITFPTRAARRMPLEEARRRTAQLSDVSDVCHVDRDREAELRGRIEELGRRQRGWFERATLRRRRVSSSGHERAPGRRS